MDMSDEGRTEQKMLKTDAIKLYSYPMQALIKFQVESAQEFVNHMLLEDEREKEDLTTKRFASMVAGTAIEFLAAELDLDHGNPDVVPKDLQEAIRKFVHDNITVKFTWG